MEGEARYDSFQVKATQRLTAGLSVVSFYTYMRNRSNTNYTVQYPGELALGLDPGTPPHIFSLSWSYELPFGRDKAFLSGDSGIVSAIVSGWRFVGRPALSVRRRPRHHRVEQPGAARLFDQVRQPGRGSGCLQG